MTIRGRHRTLEQWGIAAERFPSYLNPVLDLHGLDVVLLTFVLDGLGRHVMDDIEHPISGPSFAVTRTGERHGLVTDSGPLEVVNVYLDTERHPIPPLVPPLDLALAALLPFGGERVRLPQVALVDPHPIRTVLDLVVRETEAPGPGSGDALGALRTVLLVECARALDRHGFRAPLRTTSRTQTAIDDIRDLLDRTFARRHTLSDLADRAHLERTYLSRMFRVRTGRTITQYLADRRIAYAISLLQSTDRSVSEIATAAGYSDAAAFGRQFKQVTGVSPRSYRRTDSRPR